MFGSIEHARNVGSVNRMDGFSSTQALVREVALGKDGYER